MGIEVHGWVVLGNIGFFCQKGNLTLQLRTGPTALHFRRGNRKASSFYLVPLSSTIESKA